ncbi:hypothetical protein BH18THE2_BH18THE2_18630 [soil metagenome]
MVIMNAHFVDRSYHIIKQLQKALAKNLRFVFRKFPLTQVHPHAEPAAEAAESAGAQEEFWEMHDHLYDNQQALDGDHLLQYANTLGLDMSRLLNDMSTMFTYLVSGRISSQG